MTERPVVAIVSNSLTPYRLHLHRRIVRELPGIRLASLFTHSESNAPWANRPSAEINAIQFGPGEPSAQQGKLRFALLEWSKGGRIIRWLRTHRAAAVIMLGYNDLGRLRIICWCRRRSVPCFLFGDSNIRGDRATGVKRVIKTTVLKRVVRSCTGILVCGSLGRDYFARYGAARERMYPFPYEPDYEEIRSLSADDVRAVGDRYGLDRSRRYIVYSGRLAAEKRVDLLIDAFAQLAPERPEWDVVIVGGGPLTADLRSRVPAYLKERFRWLGFLDDQAAVSAVYRMASILMLPSDYEPWAVVINEALASGLAVIASDMVGAAADLVRDGVNGRIFSHGDLGALTACLRDVTAPGRAEAMGAAGMKILDEWRRAADPIVGLRQALIDSGVIAS